MASHKTDLANDILVQSTVACCGCATAISSQNTFCLIHILWPWRMEDDAKQDFCASYEPSTEEVIICYVARRFAFDVLPIATTIITTAATTATKQASLVATVIVYKL